MPHSSPLRCVKNVGGSGDWSRLSCLTTSDLDDMGVFIVPHRKALINLMPSILDGSSMEADLSTSLPSNGRASFTAEAFMGSFSPMEPVTLPPPIDIPSSPDVPRAPQRSKASRSRPSSSSGHPLSPAGRVVSSSAQRSFLAFSCRS